MAHIDERQKKILIVEDESIVAFDLEVQLLNAGYCVIGSVDTGAEAVRKGLQGDQDLILMDIRLKGPLNGIQAARQIKAQRNIPVIFLSALTDPDTLEEARTIPDTTFVRKPFSLPDLIKAIHRV